MYSCKLISDNAVWVYFGIQGGKFDNQMFGSFLLIPFGVLQYFWDVDFFNIGQGWDGAG